MARRPCRPIRVRTRWPCHRGSGAASAATAGIRGGAVRSLAAESFLEGSLPLYVRGNLNRRLLP